MLNQFKPYELVWVSEDHGDVPSGTMHYIGQVMSRETPNYTYMVRRVPGHPGTLAEIGVEALSELPKSTRLTHVAYAEVAGRGRFPVDMLRYDACQPVNFDLVRDSIGYVATLREGHEGEALMVAKACKGWAQWTPARWSSFLWGLRETHTIPLGDE